MRDIEREEESALRNIQYGGRECESTCRSCKKLRDSQNIRNQADKEVREGTQDCRPYHVSNCRISSVIDLVTAFSQKPKTSFPTQQ